MNMTPLETKLKALIEPVVKDCGFMLFHVQCIGGDKGSTTVQVMAEDPATKNLGVDDAAKISRAVSAILDVEDPINGAYRLEISSPGIDRLLINKDDFEYYKGFEAKIETKAPDENGQKRFRGRLNGLKDNVIHLSTDQGEAQIPYSALAKAKLVLTDELIEKTAKL
ncbi:MAG: ribosome maturation factor RimP [Alphaproteobacteria bacterium]|nr:ribosome maturation factor RimP [Alphaproteobacteria bacterium]